MCLRVCARIGALTITRLSPAQGFSAWLPSLRTGRPVRMVRLRLHVIADVQSGSGEDPIFGIGGTADILQLRFANSPVRTFNVGSLCCLLLVALHAWIWALSVAVGFFAYVRLTGERLPGLCW